MTYLPLTAGLPFFRVFVGGAGGVTSPESSMRKRLSTTCVISRLWRIAQTWKSSFSRASIRMFSGSFSGVFACPMAQTILANVASVNRVLLFVWP